MCTCPKWNKGGGREWEGRPEELIANPTCAMDPNRAIEPLTHKVRVGDGMAAIQTKNTRADRKAEAAVIVVVFVCQITSDYITQIF